MQGAMRRAPLNLRARRWRLYIVVPGLAAMLSAGLIWLNGFTQLEAQTNVGRYSSDFATGQFDPTRPSFSSDTQQLIDEIRQLVDEAQRARAADPLFLQDLRSVTNRFFWPWRTLSLFDDFSGSDQPDSPTWTSLGGSVALDPDGGLLIEGSLGDLDDFQIPGGLKASNKAEWTGSPRSFRFVDSSIQSVTARRAIRLVDSLSGNFRFRLELGPSISRSAIIGLYPMTSDASFKAESGIGGMNRMRQSWWMTGDGRIWHGSRQQANISFSIR